MSSNYLETSIANLTTLSEALLGVLDRERAALTARDVDLLGPITEEKLELCRALDAAVRALGEAPLSQQLAALEEPERAKLAPLHKTLVDQAERIRLNNAVNGKIVHRSQQSVHELINLLSGTDANLLYGQRGQSEVTAPGTAIAKA